MDAMPRRVRNSPTIQEVIRDYLKAKVEPAKFGEIYEYVSERVTLAAKKPRASVFSVLARMDGVERVGPGQYRLSE
jgi:hypothetical protein